MGIIYLIKINKNNVSVREEINAKLISACAIRIKNMIKTVSSTCM